MKKLGLLLVMLFLINCNLFAQSKIDDSLTVD